MKTITRRVAIILFLGVFLLPAEAESINPYSFQNGGLRSLPALIPTNSDEIDLSYNLFTSLGDHEFDSFALLEALSMYENHITNISTYAFTGTKLVSLHLGRNDLTRIPPLLSVASTLRNVDLSENKIEIVCSADLQGMDDLEMVNLQLNPLTTLPDIPALLPQLINVQFTSLWCCDATWPVGSAKMKTDVDAPCAEPTSLVGLSWARLTQAQVERPCANQPPYGTFLLSSTRQPPVSPMSHPSTPGLSHVLPSTPCHTRQPPVLPVNPL